MIASGMLSTSPKNKPTAQPGQGRRTAPMVKPIAKRAMKAAVIAARLSGKLMGSMIPTSTMPNTKPQRTPSVILDMSHLVGNGEKDKGLTRRVATGWYRQITAAALGKRDLKLQRLISAVLDKRAGVQ